MAHASAASEIYDVVTAIFRQRVSAFTGVALVAEQLVELTIPRFRYRIDQYLHRKRRRRLILAAAALAFGVASVQAWNEIPASSRDAPVAAGSNGAPRRIEAWQTTAFASAVRKSPDLTASPAVVVASTADYGSMVYAGQIAEMMRTAGIGAADAGPESKGRGEAGIVIYMLDPDRPSKAAAAFLAALDKAKIPFKVKRWTDHDIFAAVPDFMIFVTGGDAAAG